MCSFIVDGIPFNLEAYIEEDSELLSNQFRILLEKLKVTKNSSSGNIKSTMERFFLWYTANTDADEDFLDVMYNVEFENYVIDKYFNNKDEFVKWVEKHMDDTVYFDEERVDKETYRYTFECDGMGFVITAWVSTGSTPFSKD